MFINLLFVSLISCSFAEPRLFYGFDIDNLGESCQTNYEKAQFCQTRGHLPSSGSSSYTNYLTHYFDNLTHNYGMNYAGSCGYVALGMLLSYYDAYYDSNIVPSQYDVASESSESNLIDRRNSPGILHDTFEATGLDSIYGSSFPGYSQYLSYVQSICGYSLHAKLISIGNDYGYYRSTNNNPASTTPSQRQIILESFLSNEVGLSSGAFSITKYEVPSPDNYMDFFQNQIKSDIVSLIQSGHPVIVGLRNTYTSAKHAAIAYDYDAASGVIYFHYGQNSSSHTTHLPFGTDGYNMITSYMSVDFNFNGSKGSNYKIKTSNVTYLNASYDSTFVNWQSTHSHSFGHSFSYIDYSIHKSICSCGDYFIDLHFSTQLNYYAGHLEGFCDFCGGYMVL